MQDLIERLEKATGPSAELNEEIHLLITGKPSNHTCDSCGTSWFGMASYYTSSIDAALTLVPEGWAIHWMHGGMRQPHGQGWDICLCVNGDADIEVEGGHNISMALALCVASLKARSTTPVKAGHRAEVREDDKR